MQVDDSARLWANVYKVLVALWTVLVTIGVISNVFGERSKEPASQGLDSAFAILVYVYCALWAPTAIYTFIQDRLPKRVTIIQFFLILPFLYIAIPFITVGIIALVLQGKSTLLAKDPPRRSNTESPTSNH